MGTRGAIGFVLDGKWYVTYNHFDSYPSGLGMEVLEFCKSVEDWEILKQRVKNLTLVDEEIPVPEDLIEKYSCYGQTDVGGVRLAAGTLEDWYNLLRQIQGVATLHEIYVGNLEHMIDNHFFMRDSLFCEWAYIIDLDEMGLRVYKGFNKNTPSEKFLPPDILPPDIDPNKPVDGYYPVKLLYTYNLKRLPEFMLGVTNEFKKEYRLMHGDTLVKALDKLE